jgi:hypothetical protein
LPGKIDEERRHEIIRRMILDGNISRVAAQVGVSETTVRNVWSDVKAGKYLEYTEFVPQVEAIRRTNADVKASGKSINEIAVGLTVLHAFLELGLDPPKLPLVVKMVQNIMGETSSPELARAVEELANLQAETGLTFIQLLQLITSKKAELDNLQTKVKAALDELGGFQSKNAEAKEVLDRTLKQNAVTHQTLHEYRNDKRVLQDAAFSFSDVKLLVDFIKSARAQGFLQSAKELHELETVTGMDFKTITKEFNRIHVALQKYREEEKFLLNRTNELTQGVADLSKKEAEQLAKNGVTEEKLDQYLAFLDKLNRAGISLK